MWAVSHSGKATYPQGCVPDFLKCADTRLEMQCGSEKSRFFADANTVLKTERDKTSASGVSFLSSPLDAKARVAQK